MQRPSSHFFPLSLSALGLLAAVATVDSCSSKPPPAESPVHRAPVSKSSTPAAKPPATVAEKPVFVRPKEVHGIYLTAWSAGSKTKMAKVLAMFERTELNCVVIDVRDTGEMYFPTHIKLSDEVQGKKNLAVVKPARLMAMLSKNHIWPVARIACFRDNYVPVKHVDQAVQLPNGKPWHDRSGHFWLDPYDKRNWDYIADTVDYAMSIGFPEIQLDYVRFPSEGSSSSQVFPNKKKYLADNPKEKPEDVVAAFANFIAAKVHKGGGVLSADIFGIISSTKGDEGVGQELEKVAAPFDLVSPMVYPSHFHLGEYKIKNPNASPYAIIVKSLRDYKRRIPNKALRPWLQDFSLGIHYDAAKVRAQIKAANDVGYRDWLLWNPGNRYTEAAISRKQQRNPASQ